MASIYLALAEPIKNAFAHCFPTHAYLHGFVAALYIANLALCAHYQFND